MFRFLLLFLIVIFNAQAWSYAPTTALNYNYDTAEHLHADRNIESEAQNLNYDDMLNLRYCCSESQNSSLQKNASDGYFLALIDGLVVAKSAANRFPKNADDFLSDLPRDAKGRINPSNKVRIRPEQHSLEPGETYAPRHHGQHYHVETRADPTKVNRWGHKSMGS